MRWKNLRGSASEQQSEAHGNDPDRRSYSSDGWQEGKGRREEEGERKGVLRRLAHRGKERKRQKLGFEFQDTLPRRARVA